MGGPHLVTIGHGYSAAALAQRLGPGWTVTGTSRDAGRVARLAATGIQALHWPGADADALAQALDRATHLLISAPPDDAGDPVLAAWGARIASGAWDWIGYLSTTGVYGDHGGAWVDETTPPTPANRRSRNRLTAERQWLALGDRTGAPVHVFRLAGIYGPGRSPFDRLRAGTAQRIVKPGQVFSRIHVADIAGALAASIARPAPGTIYNLADDLPAPPEDVIAHAARLIGLPIPPAIPFEAAELSPMARSFYGESKRVSNRRLRTRLGYRLIHPDYRAGLAAILADETG